MMTCLVNLKVFVKNMPKHVVHSTIMKIAFIKGTGTIRHNRRSLKLDSVDELAQALWTMKHQTEDIRIFRQAEYEKSLTVLNLYCEKYREECQNVAQKFNRTIGDDIGCTLTKKIEEGFLSLSKAMLILGRVGRLKHISPRDFPLPDIQRVRQG